MDSRSESRTREPVGLHRAVVAVVAVVCAMGVIGCGDDGESSTAGTEVPSGVIASLDGFAEAINTYDTDTLLANTTEDFTWQSTGGVNTREEYVRHFETYYRRANFHNEPVGDRVIERDGDAYVATQVDHTTATGLDVDGVSVIRVVEVDGTWLVQEFRWRETPTDNDG